MIRLRDLMEDNDGFGREAGEALFNQLRKAVERYKANEIIQLSLSGVKRTDASFPRVSVISLGKLLKGKRGICLVGFENDDVLDNWGTAAEVENFPLLVWAGAKYRVLGPEPPEALKRIFEFVQEKDETFANEVAKKFNFSISNASNKLKKLFEEGYIWRNTRNAVSGGIEHVYVPMR